VYELHELMKGSDVYVVDYLWVMIPINFGAWDVKFWVLEWEQRSVHRPVCHRSPRRVIIFASRVDAVAHLASKFSRPASSPNSPQRVLFLA